MKKTQKIPKIIHCCWFGNNEMPELSQKCIESWKKILPDYEIKIWDESNYDVTKCDFIKEAYKAKKWAFVSDYARLDVIYNYGGIYLDTDVEVIKSFDDLLNYDAFMGFESEKYVSTGLGFGAKPKNNIIKENMEFYDNVHFINADGSFNLITCPKITTKILKKYGAKINNQNQVVKNIHLFSTEYFCPLDYYTGKLYLTSNTYSIHRYSMTWLNERDIKWHNISKKLSKIFGIKLGNLIAMMFKFPGSFFIKIRELGIGKTLKYYLNKIKTLGE